MLAAASLDLDQPQQADTRSDLADRLAVEILVHAAAQDHAQGGEATITWWPVGPEMEAGDELFLLLSPAPISESHRQALLAHDGRPANSRELAALVADAQRYGKRVPPHCFDSVKLAPGRYLSGGGIIATGRLLDNPVPDPGNNHEYSGPVGEVCLLEQPLELEELSLPNAWSESWSVTGPGHDGRRDLGERILPPSAGGARSGRRRSGKGGTKEPLRGPADVLSPDTKSQQPERVIGGWQIGESLGAGGQGEAYLATRGKDAAVAKLIKGSTTLTPEALVDLGRELDHEGLGWYREVLGQDSRSGGTWVLMDYRGENLLRMAWGMPLSSRLSALVDVGEALSYLHRNGRTWNDVKPENMAVGENGRCTLLDPDLVDVAITSGTPLHQPAELAPGFQNDLYGFIVSCVRLMVLADTVVLGKAAGGALGDQDLIEASESPELEEIIRGTRLGEFSFGPSLATENGGAATTEGKGSFPESLSIALDVLRDARDKAAAWEQTEAREERLVGSLEST